MKKLTVIVKPANREDVIDIMESCAVYGVMERRSAFQPTKTVGSKSYNRKIRMSPSSSPLSA